MGNRQDTSPIDLSRPENASVIHPKGAVHSPFPPSISARAAGGVVCCLAQDRDGSAIPSGGPENHGGGCAPARTTSAGGAAANGTAAGVGKSKTTYLLERSGLQVRPGGLVGS